MDPQWIQDIYRVALKPDAVFLSAPRDRAFDTAHVIFFSRFQLLGVGNGSFPRSRYVRELLCNYQTLHLFFFDRLGVQYGFKTINSSAQNAKVVFSRLRRRVFFFQANVPPPGGLCRGEGPGEEPPKRVASPISSAVSFDVSSEIRATLVESYIGELAFRPFVGSLVKPDAQTGTATDASTRNKATN